MVVKVRRERPDQRRHHRVTAPLYIDYAGYRLRAADWSLGGFRIENFPEKLPAQLDELSLHLSLPFQGFEVSFDAKAEVVRTNAETSMFACQFTELGERERELMSHFIEELVRGSMSDVEDTIQRIDVPVTPASLEPDVNPVSKVPVRRLPVKAMAMTGVYAVLGLFVFGYIALLSYSNFYRMEVQTAVISAPVEAVAAQAEGRVTWTDLKPGSKVKRGQVVVNLLDNKLERDIDMADLAISEERAKLLFYKQRQADELQRMRGFAKVEMKNVEQSKLDLQALEAQYRAAKNQYGRIKHLHKRGFTTDAKLDDAAQRVVTSKKRLESKRVELNSRISLADLNFGKRHYTGQNLVGEIGLLKAQAQLAANKIQLAKKKRDVLLNARQRLSVVAPFDGTILDLPHGNMGHVRRGDIVAIIEQRKARHVTAFLTQEEVQKIGLGDEALLYIPAVGETLKGTVSVIDRTSGFIKEQEQRHKPGYNWRGPTDRSAKVVLKFNEPEKISDSDVYRSGLPVVAVFPQRSTNSLMSSIKQRFASIF